MKGDIGMVRKIHRISAMIIGAYVLVHLANHLFAMGGIASHQAFMDGYRHVYRQRAVEALLMASLSFQVCSGLLLVVRGWGERHGFYERLQAISGAYLALFILVHVGAVLYGRTVLGLNTDFFYAAASLGSPARRAFFMPYYFLGISAFFAHAACAIHCLCRKRIGTPASDRIGYAITGTGCLLAGLIVAVFSGAFYRIDIPPAYQATFSLK